jgi:uncharacterized protein
MNNYILRTVFWNRDGKRLRPGWRLAAQMVIMVVILLTVAWMSAFVWVLLHRGEQIGIASPLEVFLFQTIAFVASVYIARRWLDRCSFSSLGLALDRNTARELVYGLVIAPLMLLFTFMTMQRLGWLTVISSQPAPLGTWLYWLALFSIVGFGEEVLARGYHLQTIASGTNMFWGMLLSSSLFGALHLLNPGANLASTLGIFAAGFLLAFAYYRTRRLWLSIGLHIGWNMSMGFIFGFTTSGLQIPSINTLQVSGPVLWTGGIFGPEAGLIILPALALGAGMILLYKK